jgi:hypothetical protein
VRRVLIAVGTAVVVATATLVVSAVTVGTAGAAASPGAYTPLTPTRVLDTRTGVGVPVGGVPGLSAITVPVAGHAGVPSAGGASAVQLTLTVTNTHGTGFLTIWPHGAARPQASTLNFVTGATVANSATVALPAGGSLDVYNGSPKSVNVVADVSGYYAAGATDAAGTLAPLTPARVLDTRTGGGALAPQGSVRVPVAGHGGVPATGAGAVVLNLTAVNPTATGFLTAWDGATPQPGSSTLNFVSGSTVANEAIVPVGPDGSIEILNGAAAGTVQVVADVAGYFRAGAPQTAGTYQPMTPARILDTRGGSEDPGLNTFGPLPFLGSQITLFVGEDGVPTSGVSAVAINVTVAGPADNGNLVAYPAGTPQPGTSNLNWSTGQTVADLVLAPVGAKGMVTFANTLAGGDYNLIVDVVGYVRGDHPAPVPQARSIALTGYQSPSDVAVTPTGDLYVADENGGLKLRKADGTTQTVVPGPSGGGVTSSCGSRVRDGGPAAQSCVNALKVLLAPSGEVYVVDERSARVRRIATDGTISTVAGTGHLGTGCPADGALATESCVQPVAVALDPAGLLYIADLNGGVVRRIEADGTLHDVVGLPTPGGVNSCEPGTPVDGAPELSQCIGSPSDLIFDPAGNLLVAMRGVRETVLEVNTEGVLHTAAGNSTVGRFARDNDGEQAPRADIEPYSVARTSAGDLVIGSDIQGVRRVDPTGVVTTLAGNLPFGQCATTGTAPAPRVCTGSVVGVDVDSADQVYVVNEVNKVVWVIGLAG